jgi:hypothetical protein
MRKRDVEEALKIARKLCTKLYETCEHEGCEEFGQCCFNDHLCLDADTIISHLEAYLDKR